MTSDDLDAGLRFRYHPDGSRPTSQQVFVFGSNEAGRHGAGAAAAAARYYGAVYGVGEGVTGSSYALPTKDRRIQTLPLDAVRRNVARFIEFAHGNPQMQFFVTRIGCGLAGFRDGDIAPLFSEAPANCSFAVEWKSFLEPAPRSAPRARP